MERWWGVEVEFPPTLDEVFGVTNSKQGATIFSGMSQFDWEVEAEQDESPGEFRARIQEQGDPRGYLIPIVNHITDQLTSVRLRLEEQTKGTRSRKSRSVDYTPADRASDKWRERAKQGHVTEPDRENFTEGDRDALKENLQEDKNYPEQIALEIADGVLHRHRKVEFLTKRMDGYAFFDVEHHHGGLTTVVFNTNHPLYEKLIECLKPGDEDETDAQLLGRMNQASDTLQLLFAAWARYHMEDVPDREVLYHVRQKWGQMARFILSEGSEGK